MSKLIKTITRSKGRIIPRPAGLLATLKERGVDTDPEIIYRSLFMGEPAEGQRFLVEKTQSGYCVYIVATRDGLLTPLLKAEFDPGLVLVRKIFYDGLARPYLYVTPGATEEVDGFRLPKSVEIKDARNGYTVTVVFEKYLVNPEGLDSDFIIQGGDLKLEFQRKPLVSPPDVDMIPVLTLGETKPIVETYRRLGTTIDPALLHHE